MRPMLFALSAVTATALLLADLAHADDYTYRGHLDKGGAPAQGRYHFRLTPYSDSKAGVSVTAPIELRDVGVVDGRFAAVLPSEHLPDDIERVWLQVEVRDEGESHWTSLPGRQPADLKGTECPASWALSGNAGSNPSVNFLGTTDLQTLTLRVNSSTALRIQPGGPAASIIGGSPFNSIAPDTIGAVIAGGGFASTQPNTISSDHGAIGGGYNNTISAQNGFIGGGVNNLVSRFGSSVIGGESNTASGGFSMVGSGAFNCAGAGLSWAGGFRAKVRPGSISGEPGDGCAGVPIEAVAGDSGTFVWADDQNADFVSSGTRQFLVRAEGGAVITAGGVNTPASNRLRVDGTLRVDGLGSAGATPLCRNASNQIASCSSSARYKSEIVDLDLGLDTLARLRPVSYTWTESGHADIGFVAEEVAAVDARLVILNAQDQVEGVKYERLSAVLANAVRELIRTQQTQAEALAALRQDNAGLRAELAAVREAQAQILLSLEAIGLKPPVDGLATLDHGKQ